MQYRDPTGDIAVVDDILLLLTATLITTAAILATPLGQQALSDAAAGIQAMLENLFRQAASSLPNVDAMLSWVNSTIESKEYLKKEDLSSHTVYVIYDTVKEKVVYVGRTSNFSQRQYVHQKRILSETGEVRFPEGWYSMIPLRTGMTLREARALEQSLISAYTLDGLQNAINSIAVKNWENFTYEFARINLLLSGLIL